MELRTLLVGMLALVFGSSAAAGVYLVSQGPNSSQKGDTVAIVCVKDNLQRGTSIKTEQVELREWPKAMVPEGAITKLEDVVERTAAVPLMKNEPVVESKLGSGWLSTLIEPGMRAVTIQTPNVATGMAGFILPGDKVDVLVTISSARDDDATGGAGTLTLLQNVKVLAVDQQIDAPTDGLEERELRSVTVSVTPDEAARLNLGQAKGTLSLTLRNPDDTQVNDTAVATMNKLRGLPDAGAASQDGLDLLADVEETEPVAKSEPKGGLVLPPIRTIRGSVNGSVQMYPVVTYY